MGVLVRRFQAWTVPTVASIEFKGDGGWGVLTDEGMRAVSSCTALNNLDLRCCVKVTDEGLKALQLPVPQHQRTTFTASLYDARAVQLVRSANCSVHIQTRNTAACSQGTPSTQRAPSIPRSPPRVTTWRALGRLSWCSVVRECTLHSSGVVVRTAIVARRPTSPSRNPISQPEACGGSTRHVRGRVRSRHPRCAWLGPGAARRCAVWRSVASSSRPRPSPRPHQCRCAYRAVKSPLRTGRRREEVALRHLKRTTL